MIFNYYTIPLPNSSLIPPLEYHLISIINTKPLVYWIQSCLCLVSNRKVQFLEQCRLRRLLLRSFFLDTAYLKFHTSFLNTVCDNFNYHIFNLYNVLCLYLSLITLSYPLRPLLPFGQVVPLPFSYTVLTTEFSWICLQEQEWWAFLLQHGQFSNSYNRKKWHLLLWQPLISGSSLGRG